MSSGSARRLALFAVATGAVAATVAPWPTQASAPSRAEAADSARAEVKAEQVDSDGADTAWDLVDEIEEVVPAPELSAWTVEAIPDAPDTSKHYPLWVAAREHDVTIWDRVARRPWRRGTLRRGRYVPGRFRGTRAHCSDGGEWVELQGKGYVCTGDEVEVFREAPPPHHERLPDLANVMPFRYARVVKPGAPRFDRLPKAKEARKLAKGKVPRSLATEPMNGDVFLAIGERKQVGDVAFIRTVSGKYVLESHLKYLDTPPMHGELGDVELPLAFVFGEDAPLFVPHDGTGPRRIGVAPKHARIRVADVFERNGTTYVLSEDRVILPRDSVRMVEAVQRPRSFERGSRWLHIDLSEQFLVAYEGDDPVFATLISSGKPGFNTPTGEYKLRRKYISKTMAGGEDIGEPYEVEEVPWAMYFYAGYAIHGAYWHNGFGQVRSHGCVNVAPADARWLYDWTGPDVPPGWQAAWEVGTYVYVTE